jgi:hypothetical protein
VQRAILEARSYLGVNGNPGPIPQFRVTAWNADGQIVLADPTDTNPLRIVGVAYDTVQSGAQGLFVQAGAVEGALAGLNARPGDPIYLGLVPGSLVLSPPTNPNAQKLQVGFAEFNATAGAATDLKIAVSQVQSMSSGGGGEAQSYQYQSDASESLPKLRVAIWNDQDLLILGNASDSSRTKVAGVTLSDITAGDFGPVQTEGLVKTACSGLGALAGQAVFLNEGPGGYLTTSPPQALSSAVIRIGWAVPSADMGGVVADLMLEIEVLSLP